MATIFISYASQDRETARVLAAFLEAHGHSVWWDRTIPPGRVFDEVIQEALAAARCVVVLWSSNSVRSNWVKVEAEEAAARGLLVPVLIENVTPPIQFKRIQAANLDGWDGDEHHPEFRNLLGAVEHMLGRPAQAPPQRLLRSAPRGFTQTLRTVGWSVAATLAVVGVIWGVRSWTARDGTPTETASVTAPGRSDNRAADTPPVTGGVGSEAGANAPALGTTGELVNLLAAENGGEMITAQAAGWSLTVDGSDDTYFWTTALNEAVFGFKDGRTAVLRAAEILIPGTNQHNVSELELSTSMDRPDGPFRTLGTITTRNLLIVKERFQRTTFEPTVARYVRVRALKAHGSMAPTIYEWRLLGTLR